MRRTSTLSITGSRPNCPDELRLLAKGECGGLLDLFLPKAMRRVPHFLLAVELTPANLRRFDMLLHKLMREDAGGRLRAFYFAKTAYTSTQGERLDQIPANELLPDVIKELIIRLEDGRKSIEVLFSRRGVVSRVVGGAFDEGWEAEAQKAVSEFLWEQRAKFLVPLFIPVLYVLGGAFYLMYAMALTSNGLTLLKLLFYATYTLTCLFSAVLFCLHARGTFFPHAKIAIRNPAGPADTGNKLSMSGPLSLLIQVIRLIADYFFPGPRMAGKFLLRRPPSGHPRQGYFLSGSHAR